MAATLTEVVYCANSGFGALSNSNDIVCNSSVIFVDFGNDTYLGNVVHATSGVCCILQNVQFTSRASVLRDHRLQPLGTHCYSSAPKPVLNVTYLLLLAYRCRGNKCKLTAVCKHFVCFFSGILLTQMASRTGMRQSKSYRPRSSGEIVGFCV